MTFDPAALSPSEIEDINNQASILMKRGIGLMSAADPDVAEALACFDRALDMRRRLPFENVPVLRFGMAACWLNRGDALVRLGDPAKIPAALQAYEEGIALLLELPLAADPRYPRRLAIAYQNRGLILQSQGSSLQPAVQAFKQALSVLEHGDSALIPDRRHLLAVVWMNLANAWASEPGAESEALARAAALQALAFVKDTEDTEVDDAEVGLKARHVLCQTLVSQLSLPAVSNETMPEVVHSSTDLVDDGLKLTRHWEQLGVSRFRSLACDLFRFGALVYAKYQPHFLNEFVLDNIDPDKSSTDYVESVEMRAAVQEALDQINRPRRTR